MECELTNPEYLIVTRRQPQCSPLVLGVDLDNTLICYDTLFHVLAIERGLVPKSTQTSKRAVRDAMRARGLDDEWTQLQGAVYGGRLLEAPAFPGAARALQELRARGVTLYVVSHKTRFAARGPRFDLRSAALDWLHSNDVMGEGPTRVPRQHVFFEDSQRAKVDRIAALRCTHFIDDLPELLRHPEFPWATRRVLFDPANENGATHQFDVMRHWSQLREHVSAEEPRNDSRDAVYRSV